MGARSSALLDSAAGLYSRVADRRFARNKLRFDPVFLALLEHGWLPRRGTLLDLGCGQGLLLALIVAARERHGRNDWPGNWPPPPADLLLHGIEVDADRAGAARAALSGHASVTRADVRDAVFPSCSVVAMLDVLLYLDENGQRQVVEKAFAALEPAGVLLLREADAGAGLGFRMTQCAERLREVGRGRFRNRLHYRTAARWTSLLEAAGFSVESAPMSTGTPFANVLFVCRKRDGG